MRPAGRSAKARKADETVRRKLWQHDGEPIEDLNKVPEGWTADEPDLNEFETTTHCSRQHADPHSSDIDGQIERCHKRINEGIMPSLFEKRLSVYNQAKESRNKIMEGEPEGLSWEVYRRLDSLKFMRRSLAEKGDGDEQLPNVEALLEAYRSGKLTWTPRRVTYWARGTQLSEPKEFDGDECERIGREYGKSFWVEGVSWPI